MAPHVTTDELRVGDITVPTSTPSPLKKNPIDSISEIRVDNATDRIALPIDYPVSRLKLDSNRYIDDVRPLRVAVIGAGLAGITAGILLPAKVPKIDLTIFEKNDEVVSNQEKKIWLRCLS